MTLRTSCVICVACLFRLIALRTSYLTCVPCLFRLIVLRTSYVYMCCVFVSTFRLMLHVKRASLDLGLKERVSVTGAPNDGFLLNALKSLFLISRNAL